MFGMTPEAMLRMALKMVDFNDPVSLGRIRKALRDMELEPGEKEQVIALLELARNALAEKITA